MFARLVMFIFIVSFVSCASKQSDNHKKAKVHANRLDTNMLNAIKRLEI